MTILVTGASGFIGRRVVAQLAAWQTGEDIVAASRTAPAHLPAGVRHEAVDLLADGAARMLVERVRPTKILHLAWNATPGKFWSDRNNLDWAAATLNLVSAFAAIDGQRFVAAGTCAEYDWVPGGRLEEGVSPAQPATFYGKAKDATRRAVCAAGEQFDLSVAWGRVFWLYGPEEAGGRLVSDVAKALATGQPVKTSEGSQRRDFLHVDDVAGAFVAALGGDHRGVFNIGSGEGRPIREIVATLGRLFDRSDLISYAPTPAPGEIPLIEADTAILSGEIGFRPAFSLERGLAETADWWRSNAARGDA